MLDTIVLLASTLTPMALGEIIKIETVFKTLDYTNHQLEVNELTFRAKETDEQGMANALRGIYANHAELLVKHHGIYPVDSEDNDITLRRRLLEVLVSAEDPANRDIVAVVLEEAIEDPVEAFCKICGDLTEMDMVHYQYRIEEVDSSLINSLRRLVATEATIAAEKESSAGVKAAFIKATAQHRKGPVYNFVIQATSLPVPFNTTITTLLPELELLTRPDELGAELYLLTVAADIPFEDRVSVAVNARNDIRPDPTALAADWEIERLHKEATT